MYLQSNLIHVACTNLDGISNSKSIDILNTSATRKHDIGHNNSCNNTNNHATPFLKQHIHHNFNKIQTFNYVDTVAIGICSCALGIHS